MYSQVTVKTTSRGEDREVWFILKSDHDSFTALIADMRTGAGLCGTRLETRPIYSADQQIGRRITSQFETFVALQAIVGVCELKHNLYDQNMILIQEVKVSE
jgi:hypothetical protein